MARRVTTYGAARPASPTPPAPISNSSKPNSATPASCSPRTPAQRPRPGRAPPACSPPAGGMVPGDAEARTAAVGAQLAPRIAAVVVATRGAALLAGDYVLVSRAALGRVAAGFAGGLAERFSSASGPATVGIGTVRALFDLLRGPAATTAGQTRWRGMLLSVVDGTFLVVADSTANTGRYSKHRCVNGTSSGYPQLRLSALLTCGTRS